MLRRWRWLAPALLVVILAAVFVTASSASATGPRDYGTTSSGAYHGFATPPYNTQFCNTTYLYFEYEAHRYSSDTVTLEFRAPASTGTMNMWANGDTYTYRLTVTYIPAYGTVFYWHVQSIGHHRWWFQWDPDSQPTESCRALTGNAP